jgi:hypothetical protein
LDENGQKIHPKDEIFPKGSSESEVKESLDNLSLDNSEEKE